MRITHLGVFLVLVGSSYSCATESGTEEGQAQGEIEENKPIEKIDVHAHYRGIFLLSIKTGYYTALIWALLAIKRK